MKEFFKHILSDNSEVSSKRFSGLCLIATGLILGFIVVFKDAEAGVTVVQTFIYGGAALLGIGKLIDKLNIGGGGGN